MVKNSFWKPVDRYNAEYTEPLPSQDVIVQIEAELGYKLPASYLQLMQTQNGGCPMHYCFPTSQPNNWAEDHIQIVGIFGIGREQECTLCGGSGSRFWMEEWGYPDIGVYFADCPTAGHQMLALDYRECGPQGEPSVVYVDENDDYSVIQLAPNFADFIAGLVSAEEFDNDDEFNDE